MHVCTTGGCNAEALHKVIINFLKYLTRTRKCSKVGNAS